MSVMRRVLKVCLLVVTGAAAAGCVVVPYGYGYGHGRHARPGPYYAAPPHGYPGGAEQPPRHPQRDGR